MIFTNILRVKLGAILMDLKDSIKINEKNVKKHAREATLEFENRKQDATRQHRQKDWYLWVERGFIIIMFIVAFMLLTVLGAFVYDIIFLEGANQKLADNAHSIIKVAVGAIIGRCIDINFFKNK